MKKNITSKSLNKMIRKYVNESMYSRSWERSGYDENEKTETVHEFISRWVYGILKEEDMTDKFMELKSALEENGISEEVELTIKQSLEIEDSERNEDGGVDIYHGSSDFKHEFNPDVDEVLKKIADEDEELSDAANAVLENINYDIEGMLENISGDLDDFDINNDLKQQYTETGKMQMSESQLRKYIYNKVLNEINGIY